MTNSELFALDKQYVLGTYARFPVAIERIEGSTAYDFDGRKYIDFTSGIGVNSVGGANPRWIAAVTEQAQKLAHISNLFYTEPGARLAQRLCEKTGMAGVFFSNSGAESNEALIKLARKYSFDKYGPGRACVVTLEGSFHGRTVTTLSATGQDKFHNFFFPFTEGFRFTPANDIAALEKALGNDVCALIMEPVQGEGGVLPLDGGFIAAAEKLCREKDILLMFDEVQTGVGRTGKLFAYQHFGVKPDAVSFAKGIAGGLPLGGILAAESCRDVLGAGTHATTFGANPICTAAANAVLDILEDGVLDSVSEKGAYIRSRIENMGLGCIAGPRGLGLMIGIPVKGVSHSETAKKLISAGVLILTAGADALRMLPSLTISREEIDEGLDIFEKTLKGAAI